MPGGSNGCSGALGVERGLPRLARSRRVHSTVSSGSLPAADLLRRLDQLFRRMGERTLAQQIVSGSCHSLARVPRRRAGSRTETRGFPDCPVRRCSPSTSGERSLRALAHDRAAGTDRLRGPQPLEVRLVLPVDVQQHLRPREQAALVLTGKEARAGRNVGTSVIGQQQMTAKRFETVRIVTQPRPIVARSNDP